MTFITRKLRVASLLPLVSTVAVVSVVVAACSSSTNDSTPADPNDATPSGGTPSTTATATTSASGGPTTGTANTTGAAAATGGNNNTTSALTTSATHNTTSGSVTATANGTGAAGPVGTDGPTTAGPTTAGPTTASTTGNGAGGNGAGGNGGGSTTSGSGPTFHIFMLMGQSNMAGATPRQASDNNTDERLKIWGGCNQPAGQWNVATSPPLNDCPGEKGWNTDNSVDPGIWFGKTLLERLPEGDTIGLVGTAESGESINTFISGGDHHDVILRKISEVKDAENGRFAGVIFHQGESDCNQDTWPGKVVQLYNEVKAAWGVDFDVPFILGEIPAGNAGCFSHNTQVHAAAEQLPMGYWISQEGTNIFDQYHFDHPSVVLMGTRYGESMIEALGW